MVLIKCSSIYLRLSSYRQALLDIMNTFLSVGVSSAWKLGIIRILPKCESPSSYKDLSPTIILPYLSKILKKICLQQLASFVKKNEILPSYQSVFTKVFTS